MLVELFDLVVGMGLIGLVLFFREMLHSYVEMGGLFMRGGKGFAAWYQVLLCAFFEVYMICLFVAVICVCIARGVLVARSCYNGIEKVKINKPD